MIDIVIPTKSEIYKKVSRYCDLPDLAKVMDDENLCDFYCEVMLSEMGILKLKKDENADE